MLFMIRLCSDQLAFLNASTIHAHFGREHVNIVYMYVRSVAECAVGFVTIRAKQMSAKSVLGFLLSG